LGRPSLLKVGYFRIFMHKSLNGRIKIFAIKYGAGSGTLVCELPDIQKKPV